ncbi:hypothetical protein ACQWTT_001229 [Acinetobacter baumannii]
MSLFTIEKLSYFDDMESVIEIYKKAVDLKLIYEKDLPIIPQSKAEPLTSQLLISINSGYYKFRTQKYSFTAFAKRNINTLFTMEDNKKFIQITSQSLNKDKSFTFCRSAKFYFNDDVFEFLKKYENVYFYSDFDSFDLKVGSDLRNKIIILNPEEHEDLNFYFQKIKQWNHQITKVNNAVSRLKYLINEYQKSI